MSLFKGKKTLRSPLGYPIAKLQDDRLDSLCGGSTVLRRVGNQIQTIGGEPVYLIREGVNGSMEITDTAGMTIYKVPEDGSKVTNIYGQTVFSIE